MAGGYQVQAELCDAISSADGGRPVGYKVALTSATAQELVGYPAPVFGTMLSSSTWEAPVTLDSDRISKILVDHRH